MIIKRNFNPIRVFQYVKSEVLFSLLVSLLVWWAYENQISVVALPFSISAILGSALAIFIAFRNNNSYGRWWEARTIWGGIVNSSRVLARLIITFTDSHSHQANYDNVRSEAFKKQMIYACIAWVHALRLHLRKQENWDEVEPFLEKEEFKSLEGSQNKPNFIQLLIGKKIYHAMASGVLGGFDSFQMEGQLLALANFQGGCERIKNTPLLRQYDFFTRLFLFAFIFLLPFSLIGDFNKMGVNFMMIPVSLTISFVFSILAKVGEVNEDPFENRITDVPLTAICNTIERDLREMLGEENLPEKMLPENGFLF
ncbi:hydrogenase [Algoriphagus lacus]|uniref:Hydrogenase n=1 Tax=Algoriphagus lacus TaxID=2056311 RepID=A0A418PS22_9BACT|nr:bestrophin family ion channel [Algoriphagus lacus]RIW15642.1 hydrogenase [Algoriphagus lacus]